MVSGPACPNDGTPLRWVPEQNAWGCDRCRSMFPASGPVAQPPSQPQSQPGFAPAQPGGFGGAARTPSQPPGKWHSPPSQSGYTPPQAAGFGGSAAAAGSGSNPSMPPYKSNPPSAPSAPAYAPAGGAFGGSAASSGPPRPQPSQQSMPAYGQPSGFPPSQSGYPPHAQPGYPPQNPQPSPYPSAAPYQQPAPAAAVAAETVAKKGGKGLLIGIIAAAAVGIGITVAVLVTRGGGKKGGSESTDETVASAIAAINGSDLDGLIKLTAAEQSSLMTCDEKGAADQEAGKKAMRELFQKRLDEAKGVTVELVKLGDDKTTTMKAEDTKDAHCKASSDAVLHAMQATLKLTVKGRTREKKVALNTLEIDGRHYLIDVPSLELPRECAEAARVTVVNAKTIFEEQGVGDSGMARLKKAVENHCNDDAWPDEAIDCLIKSKSDPESEKCLKMMTQSQQDKVIKAMGNIIGEYIKSKTPPPVGDVPVKPPVDDPTVPPAGSGTPVVAGSGSGSAVDTGVPEEIPQICNDFQEQIAKLKTCRRVPAQMKRGYENDHVLIAKEWDKAKPKTTQLYESTEKLCKKGVDDVLEVRKTYCR